MNQHTPGPWNIDGDAVWAATIEGILVHREPIGPFKPTRKEQEANARLIAAAPDLLHQLQEACQFVAKVSADGMGRGGSAVQAGMLASRRLIRMQAVIEQATGVTE